MLPDAARLMSEKEAPRYALLLRIGTATPLRLWTAIGPFMTTADDDLDPSAIYRGVGILRAFDEINQIVDGTAERVNFTFARSLIPKSWIDEDDSDIEGAAVNVGIVFFDDAWQTVAPVAWFWDGIADVSASQYDDGKEQIVLSVGSADTDRARADYRYWTDASHKTRHPGDNFCKLVAGYNSLRVVKWPG